MHPIPPNEKPDRPVLVWDGDCGFCAWSLRLWRSVVGERVATCPYQQLPRSGISVPRSNFEDAVHLLDTKGNWFAGAAAIFRSLRGTPWEFLERCYRRFPPFASLSERGYYCVARNRSQLGAFVKSGR